MLKTGLEKNGVTRSDQSKDFVPPYQLTEIIDFFYEARFRDKEFLHHKYIVEKKTCQEIADEICSSRTTVLKYLHLYNIRVRERVAIRNSNKTAYGKRIKDYNLVDVKKEQQSISSMRKLRLAGFSYSKIADVMNTLGVKTKSKSSVWTSKTIFQILNPDKKECLSYKERSSTLK